MLTSCPLCKNTEIRQIREKFLYTLMACDKCNFLFLREEFVAKDIYNSCYFDNYDNPASLFSAEEKSQGYAYSLPESGENGHYSQAFNALAKFCDLKGTTYLDIGCALGSGLDMAQKRGMIPFGVDISPQAITFCQKCGFENTTAGDVECVNYSNFDVVTMIDVLEHLVDPVSFIQQVRSKMKVGGFLYIKNNLFDFDQMQNNDVYFHRHYEPPYHCSYFSKPCFLQFFKNFSFSLVYQKPQYVACLLDTYVKLKKMVNSDFREMAEKNIVKRLTPEQSKRYATGSLLGNLTFRLFPAGFVFRKVR